MVGTARFELATPCTPSKCATRLRYVPTESAAQDDDDSVGVDLQILHQAASGQPLRPEWDYGRASIVVRKGGLTSERCNTLKPNSSKKALTKKVPTRWPSTWGQAADIPFSKSSGQRKTPLDAQSGERLCRSGRAILRFLWPIRQKLKECWDGPPSAIWVTSSRVRGYGWRKTRRENKRSCRCSKRFGGEASAITPTTRNRLSQRP